MTTPSGTSTAQQCGGQSSLGNNNNKNPSAINCGVTASPVASEEESGELDRAAADGSGWLVGSVVALVVAVVAALTAAGIVVMARKSNAIKR